MSTSTSISEEKLAIICFLNATTHAARLNQTAYQRTRDTFADGKGHLCVIFEFESKVYT